MENQVMVFYFSFVHCFAYHIAFFRFKINVMDVINARRTRFAIEIILFKQEHKEAEKKSINLHS